MTFYKKFSSLIFSAVAMLGGTVANAASTTIPVNPILASQEPVYVHLNRCPINFAVNPVVINGRTFVEINSLFSAMGIALAWDGVKQQVTGTYGSHTFKLWLGVTNAWVDGKNVVLDAAPFVAQEYGKTMVPLSFVAAATGATTIWRPNPRTADVFNGQNTDCVLNGVQNMAEFAYRGYLDFNEVGPISITKAQKFLNGVYVDVYLIGLSGTDLGRVKQESSATGIYEDLLVGFFSANNSYKTAAKQAIFGKVPVNANLVITGHSLGGMIAQQLAADDEIKQKYNVMNTVTLGSPLLNILQREGDVRRLGDKQDLVPALSSLGVILAPYDLLGLNVRDGGYTMAQTVKAHLESYRRRSVWADFDTVGQESHGTQIRFYTNDLKYYPAPR